MSPESIRTAGIILVVIPTIVWGGFFLFTQLSARAAGYVDNPMRRGMYTAGHAHAGVLVMLGLIMQPFADQVSMAPALEWIARFGVPMAAIAMPLGFFLSVPGANADKPNMMRYFIHLGAVLVIAGTFTLGIGLLTTT